MAGTVDGIFTLMLRQGARQYGGEAVSELAHALQGATLAEREGAAPALVVATLLHDYGHMVEGGDEGLAERGIDAGHERRGADALAALGFGPAVTEPVRLHVAAKRYLCVAEPGYAAGLSPASTLSLALQGGPMSPAEAAAFLARPHAAESVRLRHWDEQAKDPRAETPGLEHFRAVVERCLARP